MKDEIISVSYDKKRVPIGWSAVLGAGVIASVVFQLLEAVLIPLDGGGHPWGPARMIAAMLIGPSVLSLPATLDVGILAVALIVDFALAIAYTAVLSVLIRRWPLGRAILVGAIFGATLYLVNFYGFTTVFPWFVIGRNRVTLFTHVAFSVTAVMAYKNLQGRSKLVNSV